MSGTFLNDYRRLREIVESHENILAGLRQSNIPTVEVSKNVSPTLQIRQTVIDDVPQVHLDTKSDSKQLLISLGPNNTIIPLQFFQNIDWSAPSKATRALLSCVFGEFVLATSTMTGKQSPAFPNNAKKEKLDTKKVDDIIHTITRRCPSVTTKEVRTVIKTKCADAGKILKAKLKRANSFKK